jgi:hypothetical protein
MASSTLCNLLLDFSPSKEKILESGQIPSFSTHSYSFLVFDYGFYYSFFVLYNLFNIASSAAPQIPLCQRMFGIEPRTVALAVGRSNYSIHVTVMITLPKIKD